MKALGLLVIYFGYSVMAFGLDHMQGNCTSFSCTLLGQFAGSKCGSGSQPCTNKGTTQAKAKKPAGINGQTVPGTALPSGAPPLPPVTGTYTAPGLPGWSTMGAPPATIRNPASGQVFYVKG